MGGEYVHHFIKMNNVAHFQLCFDNKTNFCARNYYVCVLAIVIVVKRDFLSCMGDVVVMTVLNLGVYVSLCKKHKQIEVFRQKLKMSHIFISSRFKRS